VTLSALKDSLEGSRSGPATILQLDWIGDLCFPFETDSAAMTGRVSAASWHCSHDIGSRRALYRAPGSKWKGFRCLQFDNERWEVWLLGELYGPECSARAIKGLLLDVVEGRRAACELKGHWLLFAWDTVNRQLHVWTDRFGTLHAYHAQDGQRAVVSTCFHTAAAVVSRRSLDWPALAGFFGFGFFPQDRTFFDDVRVLRPATHHVFDAEGKVQRVQRYWDWEHKPDWTRSYDDTVSEFAARFDQVMADLLRQGRIALPVSGGLDSRCTVAAIPGDKEDGGWKMKDGRLWSYSYGYTDDSVETRISRQVAEARGLSFMPFTIKPYLFDRLEQVVAAVEGFQDVTQCRQAAVVDELRQHADYVIAAHWGDVWLDDMGLVSKIGDGRGKMGEEEIVDHTLKKMAKKSRAWLLENICAPHLGKDEPEGLLRQFVKEGMAPLQQIEDPDFRVKAFKTDNWSFRWTLSSIRMFQAAAFPRLPFYDTRLTDFFSSVPSAFVQGRRLQVDYLKRFAPDLARVKWQAYDTNLFRHQHFDSWLLPKRAVKKACRLLTRKRIIERNWEVQFGGEKGEAGLRHWLLRPGLRLHDLVSKKKIETLLEGFRVGPLQEGRGYTVSMLLTFSASLERHL